MNDILQETVRNTCCSCWVNGCGLDGMFGCIADGLDVVSPVLEQVAGCIWIFASPIAFPIIFCFPSTPHTNESSGYEISMLQAPCKHPCIWCGSTICFPCGQFFLRKSVLNNDMTKYKLWQGYHDGPHCCAVYCPSAPITITAGTYGEQDCPNLFLCLEVSILGCFYSSCCAFDVSREYQRRERGLDLDPTEQRYVSCIDFFSQIMNYCFMCGLCVGCCSCMVGICSPGSAGAQECSSDGSRAAHACCRIAAILWEGIMWTKVISIGCMSTQMFIEQRTEYNRLTQGPKAKPQFRIQAPTTQTMHDRGMDNNNDNDDTNERKGMIKMKYPWENNNTANNQSGN
jgi:hypothetical protein